jgi:hypothetical protein
MAFMVTLPIGVVGECKEVGHKKEAPSSPEASQGLTARSSLRLLLSGRPGGCRGDGDKSRRRAYNGEVARPR